MLKPSAATEAFGSGAMSATSGLAAIVFNVVDMERVEMQVKKNNVGHARRPGRVIVPPAAGQGAWFRFEVGT